MTACKFWAGLDRIDAIPPALVIGYAARRWWVERG
jgi:hypothetical protein